MSGGSGGERECAGPAEGSKTHSLSQSGINEKLFYGAGHLGGVARIDNKSVFTTSDLLGRTATIDHYRGQPGRLRF